MANIKKMTDVKILENNWTFDVKGELKNFTEDFEDETCYAYIDDTYYSIPLELKNLAEPLNGKFVKAEICMDKIGYMEVTKIRQTSDPKISESTVWTTEMYQECLQLWDNDQIEAFY